jgi:hypothetical protein
MPQCQFPVFCCFCVSEKLHKKYSWNWTKRRPKLLFCPGEGRGPNESRRGARGHPHHQGARPRPWPRPTMVRPPWSTPDDAPSPIRSLGTENPKTIGVFPRTVLQRRRRRREILGDRSLCSGTLPGREVPSEPSPSVSIAVSAVSNDLTAISIAVAASYDEKGVVLPRG